MTDETFGPRHTDLTDPIAGRGPFVGPIPG